MTLVDSYRMGENNKTLYYDSHLKSIKNSLIIQSRGKICFFKQLFIVYATGEKE